MTEPAKNPFDLMLEQFRVIVREEIEAANGGATRELVTAEALAEKIKVPVSWVYEQSRLGNVPTHRLGKYIRFDLSEVLESQKKKA